METIYFTDSQIEVTSRFVRLGDTTYSVSALTSAGFYSTISEQVLTRLLRRYSFWLLLAGTLALLVPRIHFQLSLGTLILTQDVVSWFSIPIIIATSWITTVQLSSLLLGKKGCNHMVRLQGVSGWSLSYPVADQSYGQRLAGAIRTAIKNSAGNAVTN